MSRPHVGLDGLHCPTCGAPDTIFQVNAKEPNLYWCPHEKRLFRIEEVGPRVAPA